MCVYASPVILRPRFLRNLINFCMVFVLNPHQVSAGVLNLPRLLDWRYPLIDQVAALSDPFRVAGSPSGSWYFRSKIVVRESRTPTQNRPLYVIVLKNNYNMH